MRRVWHLDERPWGNTVTFTLHTLSPHQCDAMVIHASIGTMLAKKSRIWDISEEKKREKKKKQHHCKAHFYIASCRAHSHSTSPPRNGSTSIAYWMLSGTAARGPIYIYTLLGSGKYFNFIKRKYDSSSTEGDCVQQHQSAWGHGADHIVIHSIHH